MTDDEFKSLCEENDRLWAEIKRRLDELKPLEHKWCDSNAVLRREKMRREVQAEMAQDK